MKKRTIAAIVIMLVIMMDILFPLGVLAKEYKINVISEDFSSAEDSLFVCPGDVNFDKHVGADDLIDLRNHLLSAPSTVYAEYVAIHEEVKYADVTGDGFINIIDLVRLKKNLADCMTFTGNGTMKFNGKCVYSVPLSTSLSTGAAYKVKYRYKANGDLSVKVNALGEQKSYDHESSAGNWQIVEYIFRTPLAVGSAPLFDVTITGNGELDEFGITRIHMDNELSAP